MIQALSEQHEMVILYLLVARYLYLTQWDLTFPNILPWRGLSNVNIALTLSRTRGLIYFQRDRLRDFGGHMVSATALVHDGSVDTAPMPAARRHIGSGAANSMRGQGAQPA
jgi:hypothetical protein